ncbi:hypothetical protein BDY19DRAFT_1056028 [Irpex rosettiformis]|uniref:Uncharacterized protein n=1 Tax=Irpex rosettiformis TaxID=378272 RepID=A0ACB8U7H7_9APHY|nr:hypothetical protein BDY19DRAFT_1056028 [Irpex rosettiformis]
MPPLPTNPTSTVQQTVHVSATVTRKSETINADGVKQSTVEEVSADVETTAPCTGDANVDVLSHTRRAEDDAVDSDNDEAGLSMEQILQDMINAGLQPRGPNNAKPSATAIKKGDPIRDAMKGSGKK